MTPAIGWTLFAIACLLASAVVLLVLKVRQLAKQNEQLRRANWRDDGDAPRAEREEWLDDEGRALLDKAFRVVVRDLERP